MGAGWTIPLIQDHRSASCCTIHLHKYLTELMDGHPSEIVQVRRLTDKDRTTYKCGTPCKLKATYFLKVVTQQMNRSNG